MTRYMYDAVTVANVPSDAQLVAGYQDGLYANVPELQARFPHAKVVSIAVRHTTRAHVLDVENGDATPEQAVQWLTQTMHDLDNGLLTVYCNMDVWPVARAVIKAAGIKEPNWWVARYDGDPTLPDGAVAKQFIGDYHGYDKSVVADYWPGVDPAPTKPSPAPTPKPTPAPAPKPTPAPVVPQWRKLLDHVMAVKEGVYEHWNATNGWDNHTIWGVEYGEDGVPYCVIGAWDQYHECGLDSVVPRTDNVNDFAAWAQQNGEWTEWPSIGAWADFGAGAHCEIVIGFTATTVTTKGWNSVQQGSTDSGQGNGVWVHTNPRSVPTGYLAPRFPDSVCPPTANPHDPRGGTAQTSYTWPGPATTAPTPSEDDMPYWHEGTLTPGPQPRTVQPPCGDAWAKAPNRKLHLSYDEIGNPAATVQVRVELHDGTKWSVPAEADPKTGLVTVAAAKGRVDVVFASNVQKISLQIPADTKGGASWAVEAW